MEEELSLRAVVVGCDEGSRLRFLVQAVASEKMRSGFLKYSIFSTRIDLHGTTVKMTISQCEDYEIQMKAWIFSELSDINAFFFLLCKDAESCEMLGENVNKHFPNALMMVVGVTEKFVDGKNTANRIGAHGYYQCDLKKKYEVDGAVLLGATAMLNKLGYRQLGGKLYKPPDELFCGETGSVVKPTLPKNSQDYQPVTEPIRYQGSYSVSLSSMWNNKLFSDVMIHHNQMVYYTHAVILISRIVKFTPHFPKKREVENYSTSSVATKLSDAIKGSRFFTSVESESGKVHLYVNNDIPSVIAEAVLSCLYSCKEMVCTVDEVKLRATCSEFSIEVLGEKSQWTLSMKPEYYASHRFLFSEQLSDVKFVVGPEKSILHVHGAILCGRFKKYYVMFMGSYEESNKAKVEIKEDWDKTIHQGVLQWVYTGMCNFQQAKKLNAPVVEHAETEVAGGMPLPMTDQDVVGVMLLADYHALDDLVSPCEVQLSERIITAVNQISLLTVPASILDGKLKSFLDGLLKAINYCNHCGQGKKLKEWILLLIASNFYLIYEDWKETLPKTASTEETTPKTMETTTKTMETTTKTMETTPKTMETTPKTMETTLNTMETTLKAVETTPKTMETTLKTVKTTPKTKKTTSKTKKTTPKNEETTTNQESKGLEATDRLFIERHIPYLDFVKRFKDLYITEKKN